MTDFRYLKERPDNPFRLGRHQVPAAFPDGKDARKLIAETFLPIHSVVHWEHAPAFTQGHLGSCTANAALGCLSSDPFHKPIWQFTQDDAAALYELETKIDDSQIPGEYPPNDTGSTGPWSMEALKRQGRIRDYIHTRDTHVALRMLNRGPISIGVPWFRSMFEVDENHAIHVDSASGLAGGHQVCVVANNVSAQCIRIRNSWGTGWGEQGHAWLSWGEFSWLLSQGGDVVQPVV